MSDTRYSISTKIEFAPLQIIDIPTLVKTCREKWQNLSLCRVNNSIVRLGVLEGEFHWHKHDREDEFFYVIDGLLYIDLEDRTVELAPQKGFTVPREVLHRTRAPVRTTILMVEEYTVTPTGDSL